MIPRGIGTAEDALSQVEEMKYHEAYLSGGKGIVLPGIGFDEEERNISEYRFKRL